jgi:hypothetical protein
MHKTTSIAELLLAAEANPNPPFIRSRINQTPAKQVNETRPKQACP